MRKTASEVQYFNDEIARTAAVRYLRDVLSGGHTLAKFLFEINFQRGTVFAISPKALDPSQLLQFKSGHFPQQPVGDVSPVADSVDEVAAVIYKLLGEPEKACFLENSLAVAGDPWLRNAKSRIATLGSEVYHVLLSEDRNEEVIENAIREARQIPAPIGAVGSLAGSVESSIVMHRTLTKEALRDFAETVRSVLVGAYDGEGYVVWSKAPHSSNGS